ncbi:MAG: hypothetical protein ABSB74_08845 [Tepidisphaeraceae bacterium]
MFPRRTAALAASLLLLTLGLGCYETKTPFGSAASATVDRAFVGDFTMPDKDKTDSVVILNLDDKQYFVEYSESGQDGKEPRNAKEPLRMVGYTADVNGVTFANLRGLKDDGSIDDKFMVMRVSLSPDHAKLSIRNLKDDFFKDKDVSSSEALEKVIEANLDNEKMYDGEAAVFTRAAPTTQP